MKFNKKVLITSILIILVSIGSVFMINSQKDKEVNAAVGNVKSASTAIKKSNEKLKENNLIENKKNEDKSIDKNESKVKENESKVKENESKVKENESSEKNTKTVELAISEHKGTYMPTSSLKVRENPGLQSKQIGAVNVGGKLEVTKKTEKDNDGIVWYKIESGWVSSSYLTKYVKTESPKPVKDENHDKTISKKTTENKDNNNKQSVIKKESSKVETASGDFMSNEVINVYNNANGSSVGKLNPHQKITATNKTNINGTEWYKVSFKNQVFWVKANDVVTYKRIEQPTQNQSNNNTSNVQSGNKTKYAANTIYYNGRAVKYKNVGFAGMSSNDGTTGSAQKTIDSTSNAATFGGTATFSGLDGQNTHFIGHNNKQFVGLTSASKFIVTDSAGRAFEYVQTAKYVVHANGKRVDTGASMYDRIVGTGGGERIVLQTTEVHPKKWIIEAKFNREIK